ncbi:hypothetical protein EZV62_003297 [Acer yangbiense]|uniref:Reverse transcriptase domain-containing protein n=1 Tax=Acer yangbiense TaxID=1000413 RepID=A0A5C7II20_9ROSI|nr:hypothetical protein EZV62_003297 [Acer yangbiense]
MRNLTCKLRVIKGYLKAWNHSVFSNVHARVADFKNKLSDIQDHISMHGASPTLLAQEVTLKANYLHALQDQNNFWKAQDNHGLVQIPSSTEINEAVFSLDPKSAPGPNGLVASLIALANFWFKNITKNLADRLDKIASRIISNNQAAFIQERSISDCVALVSEGVQMLDRKAFGGNVGIKLDIKKA